MNWFSKIFGKDSATRLDQPLIFLNVVQKHLNRMKQVRGIQPFVEKELENTWILQQVAANAVEKMLLTIKDGEGHSAGFTFGEDSKHFITVSTIPVALHEAAAWYTKKYGGYFSYLNQVENNVMLKMSDMKVFVHFIFGIQDSGAEQGLPWVTCGLLPLWQKDFIQALLPTDCLTANERRELGL